jgi:WS/DGAT/MGAT family acyltransferase
LAVAGGPIQPYDDAAMTSAETPARPRRVRGVDAAFLHNETRTSPWHIVGVLVFDPSTAPEGFGADVLRRVIAGRIADVEAFRRRVVDVRGAVSVPHWVIDATVDVTEHVRRAAVPGLEGLAALARLAAETARYPLPRDKPLWQIDVVEELGDGTVGVVAKVHHSIMDGTAAVGILGALFDLEPLAADAPVAEPTLPTARQGLGVGQAIRTLVRTPAIVARTATRVPGAATGFVRALRDAGRSVTLPLSAPRTVLNRSITSTRDVALTTLPLADLHEVAESFDLKFNDVVMAMCAGALREWLGDAGDLPDRALVAAVPVAVRGRSTRRSGNQVSVMFAALPTDRPDPGTRIEVVRREMRDAKATHADIGQDTMGALAEAAPWNVVGLLFRAYSDLGLANRLPPAVNLVISNVPGPPVAVYCGGARLAGLYPLGPIFDGVALNITVATCGDDVDVGIVTCPDVAPPAAALTAAVRRSLAELVALARVPSRTDA